MKSILGPFFSFPRKKKEEENLKIEWVSFSGGEGGRRGSTKGEKKVETMAAAASSLPSPPERCLGSANSGTTRGG